MSNPQAGVGRVSLTPFWGVELTGWGYYLERTWLDIHDPLHATAIVIENDHDRLAVVSLDLMVISDQFAKLVREAASEETGIPTQNILVSCTHTHNAPASGGLLGVGEVDPLYEAWAAKQAATAIIQAWRSRTAAKFSATTTQVNDLTFNRTREKGPVDPNLTLLVIENDRDVPIGILVGFQAHPTVSTVVNPRSVSRDVPGEVCERIETAFPGCLAMYIQGACGDVNFHRTFSTQEKCAEPARLLTAAALKALDGRQHLNANQLGTATKEVTLPTRRWRLDELENDRIEATQRLQDHDMEGWRDTIGRVMTNQPDDMISRHGGDEWKAVSAMCRFNVEWTDKMLLDLETRPETLKTEIQALRIGEFGIVSNASEFFTTLAMQVREQVDLPHLVLSCYSNGRIGYLPDAHDIERKTYAAYQSPKYCNQFPFIEKSGLTMVDEMSSLLNSI